MKVFSFEAFGVSSPFDPSFRYVTSPLLSPVTLAAVRSLFAVYTLASVITGIVGTYSYFSYFSDLSWIGITAYCWVSSIQSVMFVLRGKMSYPLQTSPRVLQLLYVILHSTVIVFPFFVTVVFWGFVVTPWTFETRFNTWLDFTLHMVNSVFALIEILLTNAEPSPWTHLIPIILILISYLGVANITYATQGFYPYTFVDPTLKHGMFAAYFFGILLAICVTFCVVKGKCLLRKRAILLYVKSKGQSPDEEILQEGHDMEASKVSSSIEV